MPADPLAEPEVAIIVVLPTAKAVARPALLTEACAGPVELQVTAAVRFCVLPSLKVPVAVNCCVMPLGTETFAGVTDIDTNCCPNAGVARPR